MNKFDFLMGAVYSPSKPWEILPSLTFNRVSLLLVKFLLWIWFTPFSWEFSLVSPRYWIFDTGIGCWRISTYFRIKDPLNFDLFDSGPSDPSLLCSTFSSASAFAQRRRSSSSKISYSVSLMLSIIFDFVTSSWSNFKGTVLLSTIWEWLSFSSLSWKVNISV